jgi:hypothetical protein
MIDQISDEAAQELRRLGEKLAQDVLERADANLPRGNGEGSVSEEDVLSAWAEIVPSRWEIRFSKGLLIRFVVWTLSLTAIIFLTFELSARYLTAAATVIPVLALIGVLFALSRFGILRLRPYLSRLHEKVFTYSVSWKHRRYSAAATGDLAVRLPPPWVAGGHLVQLAPQPPLLVGREDLLAELDARLSASDQRGPRVVALYGLGGAGKTSVALAYAHRHQAESRMIWQLPAEDPAVLAAKFTELAAALGVREGAGDSVAAVHSALATYSGRWLLMFDNAPGPEAVEAFLPPAGGGRVLITSRNALWPRGQAVEVRALDLDAAAGFLVARTGDTDRRAAAGLAEAVGGLPLALEQAAAYTQATGNSLATYLTEFQRQRADLLGRGQRTGYPETVAATSGLAFTQLEHSDPEAAGLLRLLAFCAPEAIPLQLLLQPRPGLTKGLRRQVAKLLEPLLTDELVVENAVAALRRYSLVSPAVGGTVSVNQLVQAATVDQMPDDLRDEWRRATIAVIEAAIPDDPEQPVKWSLLAALLPDALRVLGPEDPDTLTTRERLVYWRRKAEGVTGAEAGYEELLSDRLRVLGSEHPETLTTRAILAYWTGEAGDAAGARDQFAALLPLRERVSGPEHPDTLSIRASLARWTGEAGDAAGARDQFAALLPLRERVSGPEHPDTLTVRADLDYWTRKATGEPESG